ncbi:type II RES/Xre toxin-antitoxin system antitoxin [Mucilaginibacter koreensis]
MAAYLPIGSFDSFYQLLQGVTPARASTDFDILNLSRQGLPKKVLLSLAQKISFTLQELAEVMHISDRTLQRYEDNAVIKTEYAEKAIELARLYTRGEEVFGSMDKFKQWMKTPAHIYKGETPASLLDTSIGFDMIFKELGRIEHGIFA